MYDPINVSHRMHGFALINVYRVDNANMHLQLYEKQRIGCPGFKITAYLFG